LLSTKNNDLCSSFKTAWDQNFTILEQHKISKSLLPMVQIINYLLTNRQLGITILQWSGFKQELFGVDPEGSCGMTDSCHTVTHPNPTPLLPGWISGWFWG
jgi:hypothetical protein